MNYSTALFLINPNTRAIMVTYEAEENAKRELVKTLNQDIALGDFVVVQTSTRHKMTVCKVVEVDVDFDMDSTAHVHWIIAKIDLTVAERLLALEADAIKKIKSAELRKKREDLRDALFKDKTAMLDKLEIASIGEKPALAQDETESQAAA